MLKQSCFAMLLALSHMFSIRDAQAFIDPPYITPVAPQNGQPVSVNIRTGMCDAIANVQEITRDGSSIRILFFGLRYFNSELCDLPIFTTTESIGVYSPGAYTLQVDMWYFGGTGAVQVDTLGLVPFTVAGSPVRAEAAPINEPFALVTLLLALILFAAWQLRAPGSICLLVVLVGMSFDLRAQTVSQNAAIEVLLTTAPGAPTPDQLVNYYRRIPRSGDPPLQSLSIGNPQQVQYLMPIRATGDFLAWLQANSSSPRAILERYVVVLYPPGTDTAQPLAALRRDPYVAAAYVPLSLPPSSVSLTGFDVVGSPQVSGQYGRSALNIDASWQIAGGWALVAVIDFGLDEKHPALRQFLDDGSYFGGNFIPISSWDVGRSLLLPPNAGPDYSCIDHPETCVDEGRPLDFGSCASPPDLIPTKFGHGTHVAGLVAANGASGQGVQGTCKHCGIAMWKISYTLCLGGEVRLAWNSGAQPRALTSAVDVGAQVVSMSFGNPEAEDFCYAQFNPPVLHPDPLCVAIQYATDRAVAMVAASGNDRADLNFPAAEPNVISAGGFQESLALWDLSPGSNANCPVAPYLLPGQECGSDYTSARPHAQQELMASANAVLSTTYPNKNYIDYAHCGDGYPTQWGNGVGLCTGTSMSAPQIAGVVGIVRSINPLLRVGLPTDPSSNPSVRSVLASTTVQALAGQAWNAQYGYGHPNAAEAARKMLGGAAGTRNRVTPLFRLHSAATLDYVDVTSPQYAVALMINQKNGWLPVASLPTVPGYPAFPHGQGETLPGTPHASVYVMTTEVRPRNDGPALLPLYLMDKTYTAGVDYMLVTNQTEIEHAHGAGYNLRNIQGYIYAPCVHENTCIPAGAKKLWREYNSANDDCATFLESERQGTGGFETNGYTGFCPGTTTKLLGYAYTTISPCGSGSTLPCYSDSIFKNGFDVL